MAYKIEDIDWSKMPEGATEFSLEDGEYFFTWYDDNNYFLVSELSTEWQCCRNNISDGLYRYKVRDYHQSGTPMKKQSREERLDKALRSLIQKHFVGGELEWGWADGYSLEDLDTPLYKEIVDLLEI